MRHTYKPAPNALTQDEQRAADMQAAAERREKLVEEAHAKSARRLDEIARRAGENHIKRNEERAAAAAAQIQQDADEKLKAGALAGYREIRGTEVGFEAAWPMLRDELRQELIRQKALEKITAAPAPNSNDVAKKYIDKAYGRG